MSIGTIVLRILVISAPLWLNDFYRFYLPPKSNTLSEVLDVIIYVCWQASLIYMAWCAKWFQFSEIGFTRIQWLREIKAGLILTIPVTAIYVFVSAVNDTVLGILGMPLMPSGHPQLPNWPKALVILHLLYISFTAGFFEEVIYRGIIIRQLENRTHSKTILILASAFIFMMIHWSLSYTILVLSFTLGIFWAWAYLKYRRMVPLIISHFVFDYLSFSGMLEQWLAAINIAAI